VKATGIRGIECYWDEVKLNATGIRGFLNASGILLMLQGSGEIIFECYWDLAHPSIEGLVAEALSHVSPEFHGSGGTQTYLLTTYSHVPMRARYQNASLVGVQSATAGYQPGGWWWWSRVLIGHWGRVVKQRVRMAEGVLQRRSMIEGGGLVPPPGLLVGCPGCLVAMMVAWCL
jgi:hypothetical protein